jgi:transcriptional regulator with XRE-family HTH domain
VKVHEKIKFLRQAQGWSQEEMAVKLNMSPNGYGHLERGKTNIDLLRLEQIANVFDIAISELVNSNEKNSFYITCTSNDDSHQDNQSHWQVGSFESENIQLKSELDKQLLINELKDKELALQAREIAYLKELLDIHKNSKVILSE